MRYLFLIFILFVSNVYADSSGGSPGDSQKAGQVVYSARGGNVISFPSSDTTSGGSIAIGHGALAHQPVSAAYYNVAIGYNALSSSSMTTTAIRNTTVGAYGLYNNTTGSYNSNTGYAGLQNNTTGSNNSNTGFAGLDNNTTGSNNSNTGSTGLQNNTTGTYNSNTGYAGLYYNTTGTFNSNTGANGLYNNTTGSYNSNTGYAGLYYNTIGTYNSNTGAYGLYYNTTGSYNSNTGYAGLYNNTTNVATLGSITGGSGYTPGTYNNVVMTISSGSSAFTYPTANIVVNVGGAVSSVTIVPGFAGVGFKDTTTVLTAPAASIGGTGSGFSVPVATLHTGANNTAVGYQAGRYISNGSTVNSWSTNSTYLGMNAYPLADGDVNETVLGYGAVGNGSNTVTIGGTGTTGTIIPYGNVGIGLTSLNGGKEEILSTTEQLRLDYDATHYTSFTVSSAGDLSLTGTTGNLIIPTIKSTTGQRYLCIDTNGKLISQAAACVGT